MLALLPLLADYSATLDLSDRTEVRPRTTQVLEAAPTTPGTPAVVTTGPAVGVDLFTQPRAFLHLVDRRWDFTFTYQPSVTVPDVETGFAPELLQIGGATAAWHGRFWRLSLNEDATYGQLNSAFLVPAQTPAGEPPVVQAAPTPGTVQFGFSHTYATVGYRASRRVDLLLGAEYLVSGGLDAASRASLPLRYGPRATAILDATVSKRDHLLTTAEAEQYDFGLGPCVFLPGQAAVTGMIGAQCNPQAGIAQVEELLRHGISRTTLLTLGAGAAVTQDRLVASGPYDTEALPVGDASITQTLDHAGSTLALFAHYGPYLDIRTGTVIGAVQGTTSLIDRLSTRVTLRTNVGVLQGLPTSNPVAATILMGEVGVDFHVSKRPTVVDLSLGERGIWENEEAIGEFFSVFGYFAVTVREPTLKL